MRRILDEAELAKALTPILYQPDVLCKASALERLRAVREQIEKQADFKPLLTVETAPFLGGDQATPLGAAAAILGSLALGIFLPVTLLVVVGVLATIAYAAFTSNSFLGGVYAAIVGVFSDAGGRPSADSWASGGAFAVAPVARKRGYPRRCQIRIQKSSRR